MGILNSQEIDYDAIYITAKYINICSHYCTLSEQIMQDRSRTFFDNRLITSEYVSITSIKQNNKWSKICIRSVLFQQQKKCHSLRFIQLFAKIFVKGRIKTKQNENIFWSIQQLVVEKLSRNLERIKRQRCGANSHRIWSLCRSLATEMATSLRGKCYCVSTH